MTRILIVGPSASGKSTLADRVADEVGLPKLHLDDYFIPRAKAFVETPNGRVRTFERPSLYDGNKLARDAAAIRGGIVIEGFCLFAYPEILALGGSRYYLDAPFSLCRERRAARRPQRYSDRSFAIVGESETLRFVVPQREIPDVHVLNGRLPTAELTRQVLEVVGRVGVVSCQSTYASSLGR